MGMLMLEEKPAAGKCAMCGGRLEKSNSGYFCNPCRDSMRKK